MLVNGPDIRDHCYRIVYSDRVRPHPAVKISINLMPTCPFCSIEISEDLSLYGGHCTGCLIEIPGEEAVTDPGVAATGAHAPVPKTRRRPIVISFILGLLVVGAGWMSMQEDTSTGTGTFRRSKLAVPLSAHEDQQHVEEPAASPKAAAKPQVQKKTRPTTRAAAANKRVARPSVAETTDSSTSGPGLGSAPTDLFSTIGAAPRSRGGPKGIVLEDAVKIEEMVSRVLTRGRREVEKCFDAARQVNPGATGGWYVGFTVTTEGKPVGVGIEPLGAGNASVESCIQTSVGGWRFQRMNEAVQVSDTYRLGG